MQEGTSLLYGSVSSNGLLLHIFSRPRGSCQGSSGWSPSFFFSGNFNNCRCGKVSPAVCTPCSAIPVLAIHLQFCVQLSRSSLTACEKDHHPENPRCKAKWFATTARSFVLASKPQLCSWRQIHFLIRSCHTTSWPKNLKASEGQRHPFLLTEIDFQRIFNPSTFATPILKQDPFRTWCTLKMFTWRWCHAMLWLSRSRCSPHWMGQASCLNCRGSRGSRGSGEKQSVQSLSLKSCSGDQLLRQWFRYRSRIAHTQ